VHICPVLVFATTMALASDFLLWNPSMSTPTYIYKIVPASATPYPLTDAPPVSELDASDRFIHLSTAFQVAGTLKRFFPNEDSIYLLRIIYANVH